MWPVDMHGDTKAMNPERASEFLQRLPPGQICEILRPHMTDERMARIEAVLAERLTSLTVVVENLHDPHNGAAALRSAEAVGLQDFHAVESVELLRISRGVTMSCEQWMDLHRHPTVEACYSHLRGQGFEIWASAPGGETSLERVPADRPIALVFGSERPGLTDQALAQADGTFHIEMQGFTGSFNLSVSVALAVYTQAGRMRGALGGKGGLPAERLERLRALWYCLSVKAAGSILARQSKALNE